MLSIQNLTPFQNPGGLTPLQIEQAFNHTDGVSVIDFSFRLLDRNRNPIPVPGAPASDPGELPPHFVQNVKVEMNTQRDVHRQATLDLLEAPGLSFNPLMHRIQVYQDYFQSVNGKRTRVLHIPVGYFMGILPDRDLTDQMPVWHLTCYDETYGLAQLNFLNNYVVKAGTNLVQAAMTLLTLPLLPPSQGGTATTPAGCEMAGPAIDPSRILIPPAPAAAAMDIVFTPKDTILKAVNQLLSSGDMPYWGLWQDESGNFCSTPVYLDPPPPGWEYDSARVYDPQSGKGNILKGPVKQSFADQSAIANCCKVYSQSGQIEAFSATAFNTDLRSVISVPNLGRVITKVVQDDTLGSNAAAMARAQLSLQLAAATNDTVTFEAIAVPVHGVHDGLTVTVRGHGPATYTGSGSSLEVVYGDGPVLISSAGGPYTEISWTIDCSTRIMQHVAGAAIAI